MGGHEAVKIDGRWVCQAKNCPHRITGKGCYGCKLGKVSLSCGNTGCRWNLEVAPGDYRCKSMDVHLNANGKCLGAESK